MDTSKSQNRKRERRDTLLLLLLLLLGVVAMCVAGQLGVRLLPQWTLRNANMNSVITPDFGAPAAGGELNLAPLRQEIQTPFPWDTYLTPQSPGNIPIIPIIRFTPPGTSTATASPQPSLTQNPTPKASPTQALSPTKAPTIIYPTIIWPTLTNTPRPTSISITLTATPTRSPTSTGAPLSSTPTPTASGTATVTATVATSTPSPTASETVTATATVLTSTPTPTQTETATPIVATPTATTTNTGTPTIAPPPGNINIGPGDGAFENPGDGGSIIVDMGALRIVGNGSSTPDMVFYEFPAGGGIYLDCVVVQISENYNGPWFTVLDWCNTFTTGIDANTSVGGLLGGTIFTPEVDNTYINPNPNHLYGSLSNGVMIDIDSLGLTSSYRYVQLIAPITTTVPPDGADFDAIGLYP